MDKGFEDQLEFQLNVRKRRGRENDAAEESLFKKRAQLRKTSSEIAKKVEEHEREDSAKHITAIWNWKQKMYELANQETHWLIELNNKLLEHGDTDEETHRSTIAKILQLRKLCVDYQIALLDKKQDIRDFELETKTAPLEIQRAMAALLISSFMDQKVREQSKAKVKLKVINKVGHTISWKQHLVAEYKGSYLPSDSLVLNLSDEIKIDPTSYIWDAILGLWISAQSAVAAHIVPRSSRDSYIRALYGVYDYQGFLMDAKNGLMMFGALEEAFDRGEFIIVALDTLDEHGFREYKCRVLRKHLLDQKVFLYRQNMEKPPIYWSEIHDRVLKFPAECTLRPLRRSLFHHALSAVMRCYLLQISGWQEIWHDFSKGKMWATPEKYLNKSLLKVTYDLINVGELPKDDFLFDLVGETDKEQSQADGQMLASDLLGLVTRSKHDNDGTN